MRQGGIPKLSYIEEETLETNGEFGYKLTRKAEPVRVEDMIYLFNDVLKEDTKKKIKIDIEDFIKKDY